MKPKTYILGLVFQLMALGAYSQTTIMTFNIRYDNPGDNENNWEYRKQEIVKMIQFYTPDILGIQEGLHHQVKYLDAALVDYNYIGVGRDDGNEKGEYAAIFYKKETYKLQETKTYWLSETPNSVSVGWDASMERIATYGKFTDNTNGESIHIFNNHFDHIGQQARNNSAKLILKIIEEKVLQDKKLIVMGDLNSEPNHEPIQTLQQTLNDAYSSSQTEPYGPIGTYNDFDLNSTIHRRIDYIFTKNIQVLQYQNIDDRRTNNRYLSDHFPIIIKVK